jgi:diguanylate cyclase (GGDEF)-like protein
MIVFLLNKTRRLFENEKNLARTDTLTGTRNLRAFSEMVEHEMLRSEREHLPYSLAYIDLDNFKHINDTFGHSAGDQLLKSIVDTISQNLRKTDILGRLGGDEFAIFFPATDRPAVETVIQKIHIKLAERVDNLSYQASISVGVIICEAGIHSLDKLISSADGLMYQVKSSGKNNTYYLDFPPKNSMSNDS